MMLTITPSYAVFLALMFSALTMRVVSRRRQYRVGFGSAGDENLERRIRAHANFAEYVPLTLLLLAFAEARGAGHFWLHLLNISLVIGRLFHALGLSKKSTDEIGRVVGVAGTQTALVGGALLCLLSYF